MKNRNKERELFKKAQPFLHYDAENGRLYWKAKHSPYSKVKIGDQAGYLTKPHGYRLFMFKRKHILTHRFIFWLETNDLPIIVDHKRPELNEAGEKDNRFSNLRAADYSGNAANQPVKAGTISGLKGIEKRKNGYVARIRKNGKRHYLGTFPTIEEAQAAYDKAAGELHGVFAWKERITTALANVGHW